MTEEDESIKKFEEVITSFSRNLKQLYEAGLPPEREKAIGNDIIKEFIRKIDPIYPLVKEYVKKE